MANVESGQEIGYLDVVALDENAFERGQEFIDRVHAQAKELAKYRAGFISPDLIRVLLKPTGRERLFFSIHGLTGCEIEGVRQDAEVVTRKHDPVWKVELGEAESAEFVLSANLSGNLHAVISERLSNQTNSDSVSEHDLFALRHIYTVREIGNLSIALVQADLFKD